ENVRHGYDSDVSFGKVVANPSHYPNFWMEEHILYTKVRGRSVMCVPTAMAGAKPIRGVIIDVAHTTLGHKSALKTIDYIRRWFWW
ncbi:hypothetical protein BDN72DRAFT_750961, partial [Pluteus cervinus]